MFKQAKIHGGYLLWLHSTLYKLGYCKQEVPRIHTQLLPSTGNLWYFYIFRTFTYSSFNWLYEAFYENKKSWGGARARSLLRYPLPDE